MGMNQKTALRILGLKPGASLAEAKKAFRDLAKQYHPDRYPNDTIGDAWINRMNQMKLINQAFHLLAPLLAPPHGVSGNASDDPSTPANETPFFSDFFRMLKKKLTPRVHTKPGPKKPPKPMARQKKRSGQSLRFDTILKTLHPGGVVAGDKRENRCGLRVHPRANFMKYMDTKRKIDARTQKAGEQNFSRIERIRPVPRVKPIGDNDNS